MNIKTKPFLFIFFPFKNHQYFSSSQIVPLLWKLHLMFYFCFVEQLEEKRRTIQVKSTTS